MTYNQVFKAKLKNRSFALPDEEAVYIKCYKDVLDDDRIIKLCELMSISEEDKKCIRDCDDNSFASTDNFVNDFLYKRVENMQNNAFLLLEIFKEAELRDEVLFINNLIELRQRQQQKDISLNYRDWAQLIYMLYPSLEEKICKWEIIVKNSVADINKEEMISRYKSLEKSEYKISRFEMIDCYGSKFENLCREIG